MESPKHSEFARTVSRTASRYGMDLARPLALVSGGPDSVALLRTLAELSEEVSVLHVDHALRGEESRKDARFVEGICESLGVRCETRTLDLADDLADGECGGDLRKFHKFHNLQERAREERYRLAGEAARRCESSCIALGHNSDDVAETLLMNLARGAGTRGMASIPPSRGRIARPLIETSRAEILDYLESLGQSYRTDSTNLTGKYARNRVRLEVMPILEELYPGAARNLARAAGFAREDLEALEGLAGEMIEARANETLLRPGNADPSLVRHAIRLAYKSAAGTEVSPLDSPLVESVLEALRSNSGTRTLDLPGGVLAAARYGVEVAFYLRAVPSEVEVALSAGNAAEFGGFGLRPESVPRLDPDDASRAEVAYLDGAGAPYRVRMASEADTIRPLGLGGSKRVFRAMMDRKVPKDRRPFTPVVVDRGGRVAWVFLGETDQRFAVTRNTKEILRLEVEEL